MSSCNGPKKERKESKTKEIANSIWRNIGKIKKASTQMIVEEPGFL